MKTGVIRSSDLGVRWDAKYHLNRIENQAVVDKLLALPQEQFDRLFDLVPQYQNAMEVVLRGQGTKHSRFIEAIKSYTKQERAVFIALCLKEIQRMEDEAAEFKKKAQDLLDQKAAIERILQ